MSAEYFCDRETETARLTSHFCLSGTFISADFEAEASGDGNSSRAKGGGSDGAGISSQV